MFNILNEERIDTGLVVRMPGPHSFTGEDTVELSVHGGRAVVGALLATLGRIPGLRLAEPGEFTRRAVEHGRLDLTQAEGIADLVAAETDAQRRQALGQMDGALSALYEDWRARLVQAAAWLEASIDFADEEIPPDAVAASRDALVAIAAEVRHHLQDGRRGEILREGLHVAIVGAPNAGKSSLLNALAQRDVAIVSDTPGTTRDVIEVRLDLGGYPVILADTAGLRAAGDAIEEEGVRRARARAIAADIRLLILDSALPEPQEGLDSRVVEGAQIIVWNKADIAVGRRRGINISAKTGEGLGALIDALAAAARDHTAGEGPALTRARHRQALERAHTAIASALKAPDGSPELAAESVRVALVEIGRITGRVDLDELLDVVFRDFCIGK
jgi:tRNA modification GTPase